MPDAAATDKTSPRRTWKEVMRDLGQRLSYAAFRGLEGILRILPIQVTFLIGSTFGQIAYFFAGKYRRLAIRNLTIAFGREKTSAQIRKLGAKHFRTVCANLACSLVLPRLGREKILQRVEIVEPRGAELGKGEKNKGRLCCIPHMGAWEVLSLVPELLTGGLEPSTMYQALGNPYFDAYVRRRRSTSGLTLFDRKAGFRGPLKFLKKGGAVGILTDQHAGDHGTWAPLFGRLASTTPLPAVLAERTDAELVPIHVETAGLARWRVVTSEPVLPVATPEETSAKMNLQLEKAIRSSPHDWFWVHNRWKTPNPKFLLSTYKRGIVIPPELETTDLQPFQILVRSPNWLGDICMAIPAVRAIKAGRPDARVTVLSPEKFAPVWNLVRDVDAVIGKGDKDSPMKVGKLIKNSGVQYDAAVLLPNSLRTALEAKSAKIPRIVGFAGHGRREKILHQVVEEPHPRTPPEHQTRRLLRISQAIGGPTDTLPDSVHMLAEHQPPEGTIRVGVCPGAAYGDAKRLPTDKFAETINIANLKVPGIEWILVGTAAERGIADELQSHVQGGTTNNLVGETDLDGLIQTLAGCRALLTNDTGTMHLAAALGVPTIAIFGSTEPALTGPLGRRHTVIRNHVECSPCFLRDCPLDFRCMASIDPKELALAVVAVIEREVAKPWGSEQPD